MSSSAAPITSRSRVRKRRPSKSLKSGEANAFSSKSDLQMHLNCMYLYIDTVFLSDLFRQTVQEIDLPAVLDMKWYVPLVAHASVAIVQVRKV